MQINFPRQIISSIKVLRSEIWFFYVCNLHICQKKNCCWTFKLSKQCVSDMRGIKYHLCANLLKNTKMVISSWYIHLNVWSKMIWYKHHWYTDLLQNRDSQMARCVVAFHWCRAKSGFLKTGSKWNLKAFSNYVESEGVTRCTFWECANLNFLCGLGNFQHKIKRLLQNEINRFIIIVLHTTF